jgi:hypothetical protein
MTNLRADQTVAREVAAPRTSTPQTDGTRSPLRRSPGARNTVSTCSKRSASSSRCIASAVFVRLDLQRSDLPAQPRFLIGEQGGTDLVGVVQLQQLASPFGEVPQVPRQLLR